MVLEQAAVALLVDRALVRQADAAGADQRMMATSQCRRPRAMPGGTLAATPSVSVMLE